ncbi:MAG: carboxypeptidase regulatory-like domain-containing protein [Candidatus Micrarchaeota archaeon]|nr:carboxypeptidase regulatory-like domain-containing protein [Candidatus Micrarchaeota archaeon]
MNKILLLLLISSVLIFGCLGIEEIFSEPSNFSLEGKVLTVTGKPIPDAKIELISNKTYSSYSNSDGAFKFSNVSAGEYTIKISKEGFKSYNYSFTFYPGDYDWNFSLVRDCIYYDVDVKRDYYVRYGYNGTLYRTDLVCELPYPSSSYLNVSFPETKQEIRYVGENRVASLRIDNTNNRYNQIRFYILVDMKGTNTLKIFERKNMSISKAASLMPNYLEERTMADQAGNKRKIIDPKNAEIKSIAEQAKKSAGDDVWEVARGLFIWLKNNTKYFNQGGADGEYIQSPAEMLSSRKGDCDELSYLYISLLRSAGIPARYVEGFLVKENETRFVKHMWVEFYDGEWVPVEVAGTGRIEDEVNVNFGVERNQHVPIFVEDGTQASFDRKGCTYTFYGARPQISNYVYYTSIPHERQYIAVCGSERYLAEERE